MRSSVSYRDSQFSDRAFPRKIPYTRKHVASLLYEQLSSWKGVRYKLGGLSKGGIDCSGFVQLTFEEKLNIRLPRSIENLVKIGERVSRRHLKAGDLVFFKTGIFTRHVGIYVGNNQFMHVSKSKGVILSTMNQHYWIRHYWQSKRIIYSN
ncbi:MAG: NlpC/P60 family protein [bacterium]